ncbi:DUF4407 domain-containing protein [Micromonospora sp. CPCC 205546]|uniref:DUF4407 domain-containing protein n=1 Tax=Micromonospora sp. CPCC 205546 TaxID=3122397 RepID=UPI002FF18BE4
MNSRSPQEGPSPEAAAVQEPTTGSDAAVHVEKAPTDRGPGRYLRVLTGVDEDMLAWVPTERARYTALGGVVLGTAVLAGFSMWNALGAVFGRNYWWLALPVLAWTLFVLNLDRWLVATSTGSQWRRRASVLVPRLVVAVFLGVVVAEPLVLKIFHTAVEEHIQDGRKQELDDLRGSIVACNPLPTDSRERTITTPSDCRPFVVASGASPTGAASQLSAARKDASALRKQIDEDTAELRRLRDLTRRECAGASGSGLSGEVGEGPRCRRLERQAQSFEAEHPIGADNERLVALQRTISELESQVRAGTETAEQQRAAEIDRQVAELASHQGAIGFLERLEALGDLTEDVPSLLAATWLIRIFFILIDCLPVLVKFMTGATAYDRLVDQRIASTERLHEKATRSAESTVAEDLDVQRHRARADGDMRRQRIDFEVRRHTAQIEAEGSSAVQELARRLRRSAASPPGASEDASTPRPRNARVNGARASSRTSAEGDI